jgi:hypothetical protein
VILEALLTLLDIVELGDKKNFDGSDFDIGPPGQQRKYHQPVVITILNW